MTAVDVNKQVVEALHYVKQFSGSTILIKLGGSILDDTQLIKQLCEDLSLARAVGIAVVVVHGGSKAIEHELKLNEITWQFHEGQRVTTPEMMDIIEMVLCGQVNRVLVRTLNSVGVPSCGLAGSDTNLLLCRTHLDSQGKDTLGRVGEIISVNQRVIQPYIDEQLHHYHGRIPIIAPIGVNAQGQAMNINADWAAVKIAEALNITKLIYLTDQDGIYDEQRQLISEIDKLGLQKLIANQVVKDGMLTKTNTIISALNSGIDNIHILNARREHALIQELFTEKGVGTVCKIRSEKVYATA